MASRYSEYACDDQRHATLSAQRQASDDVEPALDGFIDCHVSGAPIASTISRCMSQGHSRVLRCVYVHEGYI